MKKKDKIKLRDRESFKFIKEKARPFIGKSLEVIADLTGKESLEALGKLVKGEPNIPHETEEQFKQRLDHDLKQLEIEETNKTERWRLDTNSDSLLSKNVRPITLLTLILLTCYVVLAGVHGLEVDNSYKSLLSTLDLTVLGGYFALRTWEKVKK